MDLRGDEGDEEEGHNHRRGEHLQSLVCSFVRWTRIRTCGFLDQETRTL